MLKWPGQVVIAGCQTYWTTEVSTALDEGNLPELFQKMLGQVQQNNQYDMASNLLGYSQFFKTISKGLSSFCTF